MMEWFNALDTALQVYWCIALGASFIFVIQMVMTFIGLDGSDGMHADFDGNLDDGGPGQVFSFRNFINCLLGYGWAAICFYPVISSALWLNVVAILVGVSFVLLFFLLMKQMTRLETDKTFRMEQALGKPADVYLTIPAQMSGRGKVQVSVGGAYHEIDAMTRGEKLQTGSKVRVDELIDGQTLLVSKLS
jgi:membrane protein implicated in regulation of membrane protease activity